MKIVEGSAMHSNGLRRMTLVVTLTLSFGISKAAAENSVTSDDIDRWTRPQVEAALRSVLQKDGCQNNAERTFKGSGVLEIKCRLGEEKITVQVSSASVSGSDAEKSFTSVRIKTTGGNKILSKIIDQEMMEALRQSDKAAPPN
jgi:hypothetical protein